MSKRGRNLSNKDRRGARRAAAARSRSGSGRAGTSSRAAKSARPSPVWRWTKRIAAGGIALALLAVLFLTVAVGFAARSIPSYYQLKAQQAGQTILVRASDGSEIVELGPSFGEWLDFEEIPETMTNAMIAVEDKRFRSHYGIDPVRTAGAVVEGLTGTRERVGGTSTITQQLARNLFLNTNRTFDRKAREAVLAMALEWKFSKEEILELYLNKVYFGGGAYGIDSASRKFFSHPATELSVAEAAIIAGLVKAPSRYSPTADVQAAVDRAQVVLRLMREQGYITPQEASVDVEAVKLKEPAGQNSVRYFTDWALPQLDILLPETLAPIEVWTTIDVGKQRAATAAIAANTPGGSQGALVSLDRDGAILALVGGTDYVETNFNRATRAMRQPGSSWKLFVFLAALEAGYRPEDVVVDTPVTIDGWSPRNANGRNIGETDLRTAFAYSINTVAAQLGNEVGFGTVASMARRFGISSPVSTFPSMVLGSSEVRLIEMTRAFAAVAAGGVSVEPYGITRVVTAGGELLYERERPRETQLVPGYVAAGMTDLLQAAIQTGTGRAANIGRPVAGKTGTTSSNKDGWFVGFSSGITTGVWMGRDDARAVPGLQGGRAPAQAFAAYMRYAVKDRPVEEFDTELDLPEWQLEPDDEYLFGDPDDYYFIDEQGNLIEPGRRGDEDSPFGTEDGREPEADVLDEPPAALDEDVLERAIGRELPEVRRGNAQQEQRQRQQQEQQRREQQQQQRGPDAAPTVAPPLPRPRDEP
ncbi:transglycosylase domain-containing protein [Erythrobacter sp. HL-111]|uniref:transglycosylase domain-containing protein n=1 Tax=Erythrobacter sp. HL-111 TaxID=1798193 RepID=UPI0006D99FCF|nr:PBP1A family penicillin-binding protein [Erythrobacter sp. HL-111]KPP87377.1 MAG: Membrane carboxypeptidase (penicillin-binding protein) [Erythrobacteraceae bacterium HL-111]SDS97354.1 penicillin-binding protein 1A [Erythrobacter sp. HL-111]